MLKERVTFCKHIYEGVGRRTRVFQFALSFTSGLAVMRFLKFNGYLNGGVYLHKIFSFDFVVSENKVFYAALPNGIHIINLPVVALLQILDIARKVLGKS